MKKRTVNKFLKLIFDNNQLGLTLLVISLNQSFHSALPYEKLRAPV